MNTLRSVYVSDAALGLHSRALTVEWHVWLSVAHFERDSFEMRRRTPYRDGSDDQGVAVMDHKVERVAMALVQRLVVLGHRLALLLWSLVVVWAPFFADRLVLHCLVAVVLVVVGHTVAAARRIVVVVVRS